MVRHSYARTFTDAWVRCLIDTPWFGLGFEILPWGVRLLLGRWHYCIHVKGVA